MNKTRTILASIAVGGMIGAGLTGIGIARADTTDDVFVQVLADQGITNKYGPAALINDGHRVCVMRIAGASEGNVANMVHDNSGMSWYNSGFFVGAAEQAYCPGYVTRGSAQA